MTDETNQAGQPVMDNSTLTVRVQWYNTRNVATDELESAFKWAPTFRYTAHQWDDTDKDGIRVTLSRFIDRRGQSVDLFATYYFTRVPCIDCETSWAAFYTTITDDENGVPSIAPRCGTHTADFVREYHDTPGFTVTLSEPLRIGQH
jgi:hypothetical protein